MYDYHVHSNYSDGDLLFRMLSAAAEADLEGIGFADHCNVSERAAMTEYKRDLGFNLDVTYERRRRAIERFRDRYDLRIFDAVEMDYDPRDETAIEAFLADADFEYAVGSVHHLEDVNVHFESYFAEYDDERLATLADRYVEKLIALIDSELFEIAAHVDLLERNPLFRGHLGSAHYERIADAFERSRTVPELNAGRVLDAYGSYHPGPELFDVLVERGIEFTIGTDSHAPAELRERVTHVKQTLADRGIEPVELSL